MVPLSSEASVRTLLLSLTGNEEVMLGAGAWARPGLRTYFPELLVISTPTRQYPVGRSSARFDPSIEIWIGQAKATDVMVSDDGQVIRFRPPAYDVVCSGANQTCEAGEFMAYFMPLVIRQKTSTNHRVRMACPPACPGFTPDDVAIEVLRSVGARLLQSSSLTNASANDTAPLDPEEEEEVTVGVLYHKPCPGFLVGRFAFVKRLLFSAACKGVVQQAHARLVPREAFVLAARCSCRFQATRVDEPRPRSYSLFGRN